MDLHELLDEALEAPTPLRLHEQLAIGRRAVRRRRLSMLLGAGTLSAALVTALLALGPPESGAGADSSTATPASAPRSADREPALPEPATVAPPGHDEFAGGQAAGFDPSGRLLVSPEWRITERIQQPITAPVQVNGLEYQVPDRSVGLELRSRTGTQWVLTWWSREGKVAFTDYQPADVGPRDLQAFVAIETALDTHRSTDAVASVAGDGVMTGRNGVRVLDQQATPSLDRAGRVTAVAKVLLPAAQPSYGWILLVRSTTGVRTYPVVGYPVVDSTVDNGLDTIAGFARWVAPQVAEGRYP